MKVALIGAFDRNNYGDLFMPVLFKKQFLVETKMNKVTFISYGLKHSDMTPYGGVSTKPVSLLVKNKSPCSVAVFVGGEILSADYSWMYINIQTGWTKILFVRVLRKLFSKYFEKLSRNVLGGITTNPWVYSKEMLNVKKVAYNSVGGRGLPKDKRTLSVLRSSDYISVRDKDIYGQCMVNNIDTKLVPDSVVLLSKYFSISDLRKLANRRHVLKVDSLGKYFVFQVNKKIGSKNVKEISEQIMLIWQTLNIKCLLVPIGYAQGHEDLYPLMKIFNAVKTPIEIVEEISIYNIAYAISSSSFYVGSSLHGAITAISYNVPHMALTSEVKKLVAFLNTWGTTKIIHTEVKNMSSNSNKLLKDTDTMKLLETSRKKIFKIAVDNFKAVNKIIIDSYKVN